MCLQMCCGNVKVISCLVELLKVLFSAHCAANTLHTCAKMAVRQQITVCCQFAMIPSAHPSFPQYVMSRH
jgi:hypothetical protein